METASLTTDRFIKTDSGFVYSEENATVECMCANPHTSDEHPEIIGKSYSFTKKCVDCNGRGHNLALRGGKKIKKTCKTCSGNGYICLDEPIIHGVCPKCNGELKHSDVNRCDFTTESDKEKMFSLVDFDNTFAVRDSNFNEQYLGFGLVGGCCDYGRYLKMTPEEFRKEVHENMMHVSQYTNFLNKDGEVCKSIKIKKTSDGWHLYPVW